MNFGDTLVTFENHNGDMFEVISMYSEDGNSSVIFFNGMITADTVPGLHFTTNRTPGYVYKNIEQGPSKYTVKLYRVFFEDIIPEHFL